MFHTLIQLICNIMFILSYLFLMFNFLLIFHFSIHLYIFYYLANKIYHNLLFYHLHISLHIVGHQSIWIFIWNVQYSIYIYTQVNTPFPSILLFFQSPVYYLPSHHTYVPFPSILLSTKSPSYLDPSDHTNLPDPCFLYNISHYIYIIFTFHQHIILQILLHLTKFLCLNHVIYHLTNHHNMLHHLNANIFLF